MIDYFEDRKKIKAFDFLVSEYFKSGFASLSKSDIDLLFFSMIHKYAEVPDESDYSLSKLLQITQSRVRNLKVKNALKYDPVDRAYIEEIFLEKAKFSRLEEDQKRISIPIYDPNVYIELENLIEKQNGYVEAQLNPKIFTIRIDQYFALLFSMESEREGRPVKEVEREYLEEIKKVINKEAKSGKGLNEKPIMTFKDVRKRILEKGVDYGFKLLLEAVPGASYISKLSKIIFESIKP